MRTSRSKAKYEKCEFVSALGGAFISRWVGQHALHRRPGWPCRRHAEQIVVMMIKNENRSTLKVDRADGTVIAFTASGTSAASDGELK